MNKIKLGVALAVALAAAPLSALAQDEAAASPITGSYGVVSDYVFRGVSQTNERPAFQAGVTYTSPFGMYVGTWGSNVDVGAGDPDWEVDGFIGYNVDFSENWNFDVMVNRYGYPGAGGSNYNELITKTKFLKTYALTVAYTDDVYGLDEDSFYYALDGNWALPNEFSIGAHVGRTTYASALTQYRDYTDYNVSVGKMVGPLALSVGYYDTDEKGNQNFSKKLADHRFVVSATIAF
ncbi:TorF family putative porin [Xanthomonas translucens]|uniref:TorF family putative porin n=1 Tax=Xanthomonas campestris pv. translucens TaxID=343 RepID=UPI001EFFF854|nr:TorF family putative porin [Xanthomonas translucens]UKE50098.1 TorF family putative porin [Xanthomonas translucens]